MKRIIFDTNTYGLLAIDNERLKVVEKIKINSSLIVYGLKIVRDELRDVPKSIKIRDKSLRIDLLNLYDSITEEHMLKFDKNTPKIAENYYKAYREFGGSKPKDDILNDFAIVSAASINNLDVVVSNDEKSMLSHNALRAYNLINSVINRRTPEFISYNKFKNLLRGESNEFL